MIPKSKISDSFIYCLILGALAIAAVDASSDPVIISRSEWNARPPKGIDDMINPVPYVVIHHSSTPAACNTTEECIKAMQWMQEFHQDNRTWLDIGYHFAVGGDGKVYEGRGWSRVGAHAPHYNNISIGICLIGNWMESLPPEQQLTAVHQLIAMGVREGKIVNDYKLVGHKQVRLGTLCPGDKLYEEIETWPHFYTTPDYRIYRKHEKFPTRVVPPDEDNKIVKRTSTF